jgi:hypothetical protein
MENGTFIQFFIARSLAPGFITWLVCVMELVQLLR